MKRTIPTQTDRISNAAIRAFIGLGLALAQQIAGAQGGMVTFEPLPDGTRFSVRLPVNGQEAGHA